MSPEELFARSHLKAELTSSLVRCVKRLEWLILMDSIRVASSEADLKPKPDVVLLRRNSIRNGSTRITPKANRQGDSVEIDGAVDLVIEVVTDSSVAKDTHRLPKLYFDAGVKEYWIADARNDDLIFVIHHRGDEEFVAAEISNDGWQKSVALGKQFRLLRPVVETEWVEFELQVKSIAA